MGFSGPGISFILTEPRDSGFERKIRARFGIESIAGGGMPKITIGITGFLEISGRDCGIEERYGGLSYQVIRVTKGYALLYPAQLKLDQV